MPQMNVKAPRSKCIASLLRVSLTKMSTLIYGCGSRSLFGAGLASQQWDSKKSAAKAIVRVCENGKEALQPHAAALSSALLQVCPVIKPPTIRRLDVM